MSSLLRIASCLSIFSAILVTVAAVDAPAQTPLFPVESSVAIHLPGPGCQNCEISNSSGTMNASGDFNGDGVVDIVVAVTGSGSGPSNYLVTVLGNKGAAPAQVATAMPPCTVASMLAADLNHDKKLDVLLSCAEGYVIAALGNGDGSFATPVMSAMPILSVGTDVGSIPGNVALADFNSDGLPDLAIATPASASNPGSLAIALNTGGGRFGAPASLSTSGFTIDEIGAGDFNGDGKQDLFVGGGSLRSVQGAYLLGNGDGTFSAPQVLFEYPFVGPFVVADFNHDGLSDVAFISDSTSGLALVMVPGNSGGLNIPFVPTFSTPIQYSPISQLFAADLIGDGSLSIVAQCAFDDIGADTLDVSLNTLVFYPNGASAFSAFSAPISYDTPNFFGIADLNGDGFLDLVGATSTNGSSLSFAPGNGDGTFAALPNTPTGGLNQNVATADMNGDGLIDVVSFDTSGTPLVFLASGNGRFVPTPNIGLPQLTPSTIAVAADFDGDGKVDVVAVQPGSVEFLGGFAFPTNAAYTVNLGKGDGTLTFKRLTPLQFYIVNAAIAGDFDGDKKQDLVITYFEPGFSTGYSTEAPQGGAVFLHGNGDGTFSNPAPITLLGNAPFLLSVADLNGDGIDDLVIADGSGFVESYLGSASGTFTPAPQSAALSPTAMVVADVTGDGKPDLITQVGVYSGNGDGTFSASPVFQFPASSGNNATGISVGDLNGDGLPDIGIIASGLSVFLNAGSGTFAEDPVTYFAGSDVGQLALIRLNPNGPETGTKLTLDALAYTGGGLTSLLNQANTAPRPLPTVTVSLAGVSSDNGVSFISSGAQVTITAQLSTAQLLSALSTPPTGTVQFFAGGSQIGTASLSASTTSITVPITGGGAITIRAVYSGDTSYPSAFGFSSLIVLPTPTTVILSPSATSVVEQGFLSLTASVQGFSPTGVVTFFDGATSLGTANLSYVTASLSTSLASVGPHLLTASYSGDGYNLAGTSAPIIVTVLAPTTVTLNSSATSANEQQPVTLMASVQGASPTGTITFFAGTTPLGTANLSNGTASLTTSFANAGIFSLTAGYSGDASNVASTSAAITITVVAPDFAISSAPGSASVSPGQSAAFIITMTPSGGFNTAVTFTCSSPLPAGINCDFNPYSITSANESPATTQLTINTAAPSAAIRQAIPGLRNWSPWSRTATIVSLSGLLGFFFGRRRLTRAMWSSRLYLFILPAIASMLLLSSCGGGSSSKGNSSPTNPGTPAGSATITVIATASSGQRHTTTLTLAVN